MGWLDIYLDIGYWHTRLATTVRSCIRGPFLYPQKGLRLFQYSHTTPSIEVTSVISGNVKSGSTRNISTTPSLNSFSF